MSELSDKSTNNDIIPYVVFDYSKHTDSSIEYGSSTNEKLYDVLINILKDYMVSHEFVNESDDEDDDDDDDDEADDDEDISESELTCSECECRVVSKKYIKMTDKGNLCTSCNLLDIIINKDVFIKFIKYLKKNGENCDIIYFKDGKWCDFKVV